jgi:hypothetical protein
MTLPNPEHLFDQAARLTVPQAPGAPRQVDLRRAVSAAYYSLFHAILTEAADVVVGRAQRASPLYGLVYRTVTHRGLRDLCEDFSKQNLPDRYARYVPVGAIDADLLVVAKAVVDLQQRRHSADYDPHYRLTTSEVELFLATGRAALGHWQRSSLEWRRAFVLLWLFPPRDRR